MTEREKQVILDKAKAFIRDRIAQNHNRNTEKLKDISEFIVNPFLIKYLAQFAFGNSSPRSMAKVLIFPRVLGTSITTSFGTNIQYFCKDVLSAYASFTDGIDIEFIDALDNRRKFCQVKAGPNNINRDDIVVIKNHFRELINRGRANGARVLTDDCMVGILYGQPLDLNAHYQKIANDYPVVIGRDFWYHLTGDNDFYDDLISAFEEVADEMDSSALLQETIDSLAAQIDEMQQNG